MSTRNNYYLDNSESSATDDRDDFRTVEERNVQIYAKHMLQGRLFLGQFQEKRLVEPLQAYRDVIAVNESEVGLKNDLNVLRRKLRDYYKQNCWIGITDPEFIGAPNAHCLWVESGNNTFGYYWYKIKSVRFRRKEISLRLKIVRPMTDTDNYIQNNHSAHGKVDSSSLFDLDLILENAKNGIKENVNWFFSEGFTINNMKQAFTFVSIFVAALATSTVYGVGYFMDFILKLFHEISVFVHASTPIMIAIVDMVGKIIGGFYLLIAMIWRGKPPEPINYGQSRYRPISNTRPRAIEDSRYRPIPTEAPKFRYRSPISITEVE